MESKDTAASSSAAMAEQKKPSVPRPRVQYIPPSQTQPTSWSSARQAILLTMSLIFAAVAIYRGLLTFTGGVGPHEDEVVMTFAIIKPDCAKFKDEILKKIQDSEFRIVRQRDLQMSTEMAQDFYREHENTFFFPDLIKFMTSGPVTALVLEKNNAIKDWRSWIGPTNAQRAKEVCPGCLRAQYGTDNQANCLHGSDSSKGAEREIDLFFLGGDLRPQDDESTEASQKAEGEMPADESDRTEL